MKCIICGGKTQFYFNKKWEFPYISMLKEADFHKCDDCGFTFSKTLFDMPHSDWVKLNEAFHLYIENPVNAKQQNQPPYLEQASMLNLLIKNNIINSQSMVDFGGGMGTIAKVLKKYFDIKLQVYDPYIKADDNKEVEYVSLDANQKKKVVFNSALFEHIIKRADIDEIDSYVDNDGVLIIHTLVCENVPKDPNWFYIVPPVHSALYTNKSMDVLMNQLGYVSSLYCPSSKCWILFKKQPTSLLEKVELINQELQTSYFVYKKGFVDYWKGF